MLNSLMGIPHAKQSHEHPSCCLQLVSGEGLALAPALCEAMQALLARLQEQVAAAAAADPLGGMPLPARCHGLLQLILEVAWQVGWGWVKGACGWVDAKQ
mgnify:CR=1 FL=1